MWKVPMLFFFFTGPLQLEQYHLPTPTEEQVVGMPAIQEETTPQVAVRTLQNLWLYVRKTSPSKYSAKVL